MSVEEIEGKLIAARARLKEIMARVSKTGGNNIETYRNVYDEVSTLERELAAAKGEEYAVTIDFPVQWDIGAPLPHVLVNDWFVFVIFYVATSDSNWDGTYVTVVNPASESVDAIAVAEFHHPTSVKFGDPNDEVFRGHPLYDRGLEPYRAQIVENSRWLRELETINKVHSNYKEEYWRDRKHYVLWFKDNTFECIARGFHVDVHQDRLESVLNQVTTRLFG